jgi:hypothetical protein
MKRYLKLLLRKRACQLAKRRAFYSKLEYKIPSWLDFKEKKIKYYFKPGEFKFGSAL